METTPDTLREHARTGFRPFDEEIRAHAEAWSADRTQLAHADAMIAKQQASIEALEKRRAVKCPVCDGHGRRNAPAEWGTTNPLAIRCHACNGVGWFWSDVVPAALAAGEE